MHENSGSTVVKVLAGCAVVACIGLAILVVGGYFAAKKGMEIATKEGRVQIASQYEKLKAENKVPAEHIALFDDLVAVSQDPNSSMFTVSMVLVAGVQSIQKGELAEEDIKNITTIRDFVKSNPDCTLMEFATFIEAHPELEKFQEQLQAAPLGMGESM
ncbi:MAG TPA: hypothetical protein PLJ47_12920, partial [Candidatus Hydrogenedentes bacterium]|nr:hypothetical protein [Candidatus Hydrogenedentota bacterium]